MKVAIAGILAGTALCAGVQATANIIKNGGIENWSPDDYELETDIDVQIDNSEIPWEDTSLITETERDNNIMLWELAHQYQVERIFEHDDHWIESQSDEMYSRYQHFRKDPMFQRLSSVQVQEFELKSGTGTCKTTIANDFLTGEQFMWHEEIAHNKK